MVWLCIQEIPKNLQNIFYKTLGNSESLKIVGYKVNIQKSTISLYTGNILMETENLKISCRLSQKRKSLYKAKKTGTGAVCWEIWNTNKKKNQA